MCKRIILIICLTLLMLASGCTGTPADRTVTLSGAFALYPMAVRWQEEYAKLKPEIKIEVSAGGAGKGMTDLLGGLVDIAMVSREINPAETEKGARPYPVAKDAVIPTVSSANPAITTLRQRGLTREECATLWMKEAEARWKQFPGLPEAGAVKVYTRSDACGAGEVWAKFLGGKSQDDLYGVQVYGDPGLAEAVVKDPHGVGYNNIGFAYDPSTLKPVAGLEILKVDFNGNGRIDPDEDVYAARDVLTAAIRDGKFPSPPARNLFFVVKNAPAKTAARDFIVWVLTDGQRFVAESGYITVKDEELSRCLSSLR